jgi:hypothetical protein
VFLFYFLKNQIGANGITSEIFVSNDALAPRCMEHIFCYKTSASIVLAVFYWFNHLYWLTAEQSSSDHGTI